MSENKCPKCGASISANKQYCPHCGARLSLAIETPIIIEEKQELSPKTKKILRIAGISAAAFAVIGATIGLLTPLVFVPSAQISEVKKGNIYSFDKIGDSYSVKANPSLIKYFSEYLPSEITIPNEYKGLPVTEIESSGFSHCYSLTSITIPNSVTSIGSDAFYDCSSLTSITIPNSVTSIGSDAFYDCSSLTSITIPNSVTSIGEYAFLDCSSLTSITIPFVGESSTSSDGYFGYLFGAGSYYRNYLYVPTSLKEVRISDGCTSIGEGAFYDCSHFTSITIPNSVTSIGEYAFYECDNLDKVFYAGSVDEWFSISVGNGNEDLKNSVYYYSEEEPTRLGDYWHYVDGVPTIWDN